MSFSFLIDLSDDASRVRQMIGDVTETGCLVQDETIAYYLTTCGGILQTALQLAQDLMARFATQVDSDVDGQGLKASQRFAQFKNLAATLERRIGAEAGSAAAGTDANFAGIGVWGSTAQEVVDGRDDCESATNAPLRWL